MSRILATSSPAGIAPDHLYEWLRSMALIRCLEETLLALYSQGRVCGTVHTCLGQEACAVGVARALDRDRDWVYSNHRGHGHFVAFTGQVRPLLAEVLGRHDGAAAGVGGSQHLHAARYFSNGIQGAGLPVALGLALGAARSGSGAVATVFIGDGTFGQGVVYEALNMASLWSAPLLVVVEDNGYAQSTPKHVQHAGTFESRFRAFDIPVLSASGQDVRAVYSAAQQAASVCREQHGPCGLVLQTYRFGPHSKGDDHRAPEELEGIRASDPIERLARDLDSERARAVIDDARAEIAREVEGLS